MISLIGRRASKAAGYTLIELILLTVIILIIVVAAAPKFRGTFSRLELEQSAYNLAKLATFIQQKAVIEGRVYKLLLDTEKSEYYILCEDQKRLGTFKRISGRYGRVFRLPRDVRLQSDKKGIRFFPDGRSDKGAVTLKGKRGRRDIKVTGNLGHVEIK